MNRIILILLLAMFSLNMGIAQDESILSNKSEYEYLIGLRYSNVRELEGFTYKSRLSMNRGNGIETSSTVLTIDKVQIYTSEIRKWDASIEKSQYEIVDIIVLNGEFASCEDCYISDLKNVTIKTFHNIDDLNKDTILLAYAKSYDTGLYEKISIQGLKRNPNADRLSKN